MNLTNSQTRQIGGMVNLHFIAGLPRSGSTLLAAILKQNPRFTAGMASPVAEVYFALENAMGQRNEGAIFISDEQRRSALRGLFDSFYPRQDGVIFDNNRMWLARLPALVQLFPEAKIIATVRDLAWIMDSFERLKRRSPFEPSGLYGHTTAGTIYDRVQWLQGTGGVVGFAFNALKEALAGEYADRVLLVEYDDLCGAPATTMANIYDFVGEEHFVHDFDNVQYSASEFDARAGARGLHDIGGKVEYRERKTILPPDIFSRYANDQFWRKPELSTLKVVNG